MHAGGYITEKTLKPGEHLRVDTGCLVAYSHTVDFDIDFVKCVKKVLFGVEVLLFERLIG